MASSTDAYKAATPAVKKEILNAVQTTNVVEESASSADAECLAHAAPSKNPDAVSIHTARVAKETMYRPYVVALGATVPSR